MPFSSSKLGRRPKKVAGRPKKGLCPNSQIFGLYIKSIKSILKTVVFSSIHSFVHPLVVNEEY